MTCTAQADTLKVPAGRSPNSAFSDPIADGPTIQAAFTAALSRKIKVADVFAAVVRSQAKLTYDGVAAPVPQTNVALTGASSDARVEPLLGEIVRFEVADGAAVVALGQKISAQQLAGVEDVAA